MNILQFTYDSQFLVKIFPHFENKMTLYSMLKTLQWSYALVLQ